MTAKDTSVSTGKVDVSAKKNPNKSKSNRGCWIISGIGCALVILIVGAVIGLIVMTVALGSSGGSVSENILHEGSDGKIAVIKVDGIITESESTDLFSSSGATADSINKQIDQAMEDDSVKGILLRMNTPGGEAVASELIYDKIMEAREDKKVVTWMSGMGASGGYLIASGGDKIVAHPGCITGSIGTVLEATGFDELYEKIGIETRTFKSGEFKDDEGIFDDNPNGEADAIYQGLVDEAYNSFVDDIVQGRDMDRATVVKLADGRVYSGKQAKENGLVDEVGNMDDAIDELEDLLDKEDLTVIEYSSDGFWSGLYDYQTSLLRKINPLPEKTTFGIKVYYLMDI